MITKNEYINIMKGALQVMPELSKHFSITDREDDLENFFSGLNDIRKIYKIVKNSYECYQLYASSNTEQYHNNIEPLEQVCSFINVRLKLSIAKGIKLQHDNWHIYRNINNIAKFYYEDVDITNIIDTDGD